MKRMGGKVAVVGITGLGEVCVATVVDRTGGDGVAMGKSMMSGLTSSKLYGS